MSIIITTFLLAFFIGLFVFVVNKFIGNENNKSNESRRDIYYEFEYLFSPLQYGSKRSFLFWLLLIAFVLTLVIFLGLYYDTFSIRSELDKSVLTNLFTTFLGIGITIFFGVIISLRISTNNIGRLLSKIANMLNEASHSDELFVILPTPFLGYVKFKRQHKRISDYLLDSNNNYKLAFLDDKINGSSIIERLNKDYNFRDKTCSTRNKTDEQQINEKMEQVWEDLEKLVSWRRSKVSSGGLESDLFQFHIDEIDNSTLLPKEKYQYLWAMGEFIEKIEKLGKSSSINIKYNYLSTVFPIIVANVTKQKILLGTVRVESQTIVQFEGDIIEKANDLCCKASDIFASFTV